MDGDPVPKHANQEITMFRKLAFAALTAGLLTVVTAVAGPTSPASANNTTDPSHPNYTYPYRTSCDGHQSDWSVWGSPKRTTKIDIHPNRVEINFRDGRGTFVYTQSSEYHTLLFANGHLQLTVHDGAKIARVCSGNGNDYIDLREAGGPVYVNAERGDDVVLGSKSNDRLVGGIGADDLRGYGGNDWVSSGGHAGDSINGGAGLDSCTRPAPRQLAAGCELGLTFQAVGTGISRSWG